MFRQFPAKCTYYKRIYIEVCPGKYSQHLIPKDEAIIKYDVEQIIFTITLAA